VAAAAVAANRCSLTSTVDAAACGRLVAPQQHTRFRHTCTHVTPLLHCTSAAGTVDSHSPVCPRDVVPPGRWCVAWPYSVRVMMALRIDWCFHMSCGCVHAACGCEMVRACCVWTGCRDRSARNAPWYAPVCTATSRGACQGLCQRCWVCWLPSPLRWLVLCRHWLVSCSHGLVLCVVHRCSRGTAAQSQRMKGMQSKAPAQAMQVLCVLRPRGSNSTLPAWHQGATAPLDSRPRPTDTRGVAPRHRNASQHDTATQTRCAHTHNTSTLPSHTHNTSTPVMHTFAVRGTVWWVAAGRTSLCTDSTPATVDLLGRASTTAAGCFAAPAAARDTAPHTRSRGSKGTCLIPSPMSSAHQTPTAAASAPGRCHCCAGVHPRGGRECSATTEPRPTNNLGPHTAAGNCAAVCGRSRRGRGPSPRSSSAPAAHRIVTAWGLRRRAHRDTHTHSTAQHRWCVSTAAWRQCHISPPPCAGRLGEERRCRTCSVHAGGTRVRTSFLHGWRVALEHAGCAAACAGTSTSAAATLRDGVVTLAASSGFAG
jgi:hypothetical protein